MSKFQKITKKIGNVLYQNSPQILSGLACAGVISTTVLGVKATLKCQKVLDEYKIIFADADRETKKEIVKDIIKTYSYTIASGSITIVCIIASQKINTKRAAALASLYSISKEMLSTYKENVIEEIGQEAERKIQTKIKQKSVDDSKAEQKNIYLSNGTVLCYDPQSGRYFNTDYEAIRQIVNNLNKRLITEMFIDLNEFYYELGLPAIKQGDEMGWYIDQGLIEVDYDTMLSEDNKPCIVINYTVQPKATYP